MISIIDYDCGNLISIYSILKKLNIKSIITRDPYQILNSNKIILPGIGNFEHCINSLEKYGLNEVLLQSSIQNKSKILGICVGMQILFSSSDESQKPGLNLIEGNVKKFNLSKKSNLPHIGWNNVEHIKDCLLTNNLKQSKFYFCHSYHVNVDNTQSIISYTKYEYDFCSIVNKDNIYGVQFHPEKSLDNGTLLLKNFAINV